MGAAYWFVPHGLLSLLSYSTQGHHPAGGTTHSELDLLTSAINQEIASQPWPLGGRMTLAQGHRRLLENTHVCIRFITVAKLQL